MTTTTIPTIPAGTMDELIRGLATRIGDGWRAFEDGATTVQHFRQTGEAKQLMAKCMHLWGFGRGPTEAEVEELLAWIKISVND